MDNIKIVLPPRAKSNIDMDLCYLTQCIVQNSLGEKMGGFLGGEWGYGTDYENEVLFIQHCCQGFCDEDEEGKPTCKACKRGCNFLHKKSGLKIEWYKWIGRSMEFTPKEPLKEEWDTIFNECIKSLGTTGDAK